MDLDYSSSSETICMSGGDILESGIKAIQKVYIPPKEKPAEPEQPATETAA